MLMSAPFKMVRAGSRDLRCLVGNRMHTGCQARIVLQHQLFHKVRRHSQTPGVTSSVTYWRSDDNLRHRRRPPSARTKRSGEAKAASPWFHETDSDGRYGSETVVPSPSALMVHTSVAVFDAYVYAAQPDGGFGTEAMNGPATWFWQIGRASCRERVQVSPVGGTTPI